MAVPDLTGLMQPRRLSSASAPYGLSTALTPYVDYSKKLMEEAFPGGRAGVDEAALQRDIQRRLYAPGGAFPKLAAAGVTPAASAESPWGDQPLLHQTAQRVTGEAYQDWLDRSVNRQLAALGAYRQAALTEPTFALQEAPITGEYGVDPLTGQPMPTLATKQLAQQESQFGRQLGSTERMAQLTRELQTELQKGELSSREKIATLQATIQREQLAQQARISALQMALQRELQTQAEAARRGDQTARLASGERIAALQAELTKSQQALQQAIALGNIGGTPTLENVLGERKLDIFQSAVEAAERQAKNKMYSDLLAGLAMRSGFLGTGIGAPGVIDRLLQGTIGRAGNAVVDAILGVAGGGTAAWPTFASLGLENPALGPLSEGDYFLPGFPSIDPTTGLPAANLPVGGVGVAAPSVPAWPTFTDLGLGTPALGPLSEMDPWVWVPDDAFSGIGDAFSGISDVFSGGISDISDLLLGGFF